MRGLRQTLMLSGLSLLSLLMGSCSRGPVSPNNNQGNLIGNSNFQVAGTASMRGWITSGSTQIVAVPPPSDAKYSLQLNPGWLAPGGATYARTYITRQSGTGIYDLSLWEKSFANFSVKISVGHWSQGQFSEVKSYTTDDTVWHSISILDTLSTQPSDTIAVELFAGSYEAVYVYWKALIGSVKLERTQ